MRKFLIYVIFILFISSCSWEKSLEIKGDFKEKKNNIIEKLEQKKLEKRKEIEKKVSKIYNFSKRDLEFFKNWQKSEQTQKLQFFLKALGFFDWEINWIYSDKITDSIKIFLYKNCAWSKNNKWILDENWIICLNRQKIKILTDIKENKNKTIPSLNSFPLAKGQEATKKKKEYKTVWELYTFKEDGTDDLILGSRWETVKKLQEILNKLAYMKWNITWDYDEKTLQAQKKLLIEKCGWPLDNTGTMWPLARECIKKLKIRVWKIEKDNSEIKKQEQEKIKQEEIKKLKKQRKKEEEKKKNEQIEKKKLEEEKLKAEKIKKENELKKQEERIKRQKLEEEKKKQIEEKFDINKYIIEWKTEIPKEFLKTNAQRKAEKEKREMLIKKAQEEKKKKLKEQKRKKEIGEKIKKEKIMEEKRKIEEFEKKKQALIEAKAQEMFEEYKRKNLKKEIKMESKVEAYERIINAEAKAGVEKKIKEEENVIKELEERLRNHKSFLEEYKKQKKGIVWKDIVYEKAKIIEEKEVKKTIKIEKQKDKEIYKPSFWFYKKSAWTIICEKTRNLVWVNLATFKEIWDWYARDIYKVYYGCKVIKVWKINNFKIVKFGFARDKNRIYYRGSNIVVKNPESFNVRTKGSFEVAYDDNHIYLYDYDKIIKILDWVSYDNFEFLDKTYLRAWNRILSLVFRNNKWDFVDVPWTDAITFETLVYGFAKDKDNVYYKWSKVPNIDTKTIKVKSSKKVIDKNWTWILWAWGVFRKQ